MSWGEAKLCRWQCCWFPSWVVACLPILWTMAAAAYCWLLSALAMCLITAHSKMIATMSQCFLRDVDSADAASWCTMRIYATSAKYLFDSFCWFVDCDWHDGACSWEFQRFEQHVTWDMWNLINNFKDSEFIWVVFCNILGWLRQEPLPYPQTDSESVAIRFLARATVAGLFAHRWPGVGRMLGCSPNISCAGDRFGT